MPKISHTRLSQLRNSDMLPTATDSTVSYLDPCSRDMLRSLTGEHISRGDHSLAAHTFYEGLKSEDLAVVVGPAMSRLIPLEELVQVEVASADMRPGTETVSLADANLS